METRLDKRTFLKSFAQMVGACALTPLMSETAHAAADANATVTQTAAAQLKPLRQTWGQNVFRAAGYGGHCTAYALDRMFEATGLWMKVRGSAYKWTAEARAAGWTVGKRPEVNSVLVMQSPPGYKYEIKRNDGVVYQTAIPSLGHVAWVEDYTNGRVYVRDKNWKRGQIDTRWIKVAGAPVDFIYAFR
jgi:surface antigen